MEYLTHGFTLKKSLKAIAWSLLVFAIFLLILQGIVILIPIAAVTFLIYKGVNFIKNKASSFNFISHKEEHAFEICEDVQGFDSIDKVIDVEYQEINK